MLFKNLLHLGIYIYCTRIGDNWLYVVCEFVVFGFMSIENLLYSGISLYVVQDLVAFRYRYVFYQLATFVNVSFEDRLHSDKCRSKIGLIFGYKIQIVLLFSPCQFEQEQELY